MARENIKCAVMFADVAGSTALYDKYGDTKAKNAIENCINLMADVTGRKNGVVIKTIGDEIMCRFPTATDCMGAAVEIQEAVKIIASGADGIVIKLRIGLHSGDAILENNDVFGDAVNVAARMAGIAKADQIITTEDTYNQLSGFLKSLCRKFDTTAVKGKADLITIYDVLWDDEDDDVTSIAYTSSVTAVDSQITLVAMGDTKVLSQNDMPITIGRGAKASVPVNAPLASRIHAKIDFNRGKFVLVDQSTNGTYVQLSDGKEVFLRREELPLSSAGSIALGEKVEVSQSPISFVIG